MRKLQAQDLLDLVAAENPYNRQNQNRTAEFHVYQAGFLAAYLTSLMQEDPWIFKRFQQHTKEVKARRK